MHFQAIKESLQAIQNYNPKANLFLRVVGKGSAQHLEVVKKNWFGRLLMLLGCTSASMKTVAQFVGTHMGPLSKAASADSKAQLHLNLLVGRISKYDIKHPRKIHHVVALINKVVQAQQAAQPEGSTVTHAPKTSLRIITTPTENPPPIVKIDSGSDPNKSPLMSPMQSPIQSPMSADPCKAVAVRRKSIKMLNKAIRDYKRASLIAPPTPTPLSPMPNAPFVKPGEKPEMSEKQLLALFDKARGNVVTMNRLFLHYLDALGAQSRPSQGPVFAFRMGVLINAMTLGEIIKYVDVDPDTFDVFSFRQGSVYCCDARLIGAIGLMSEDQLKALIETIAKSPKWNPANRKDAFLKIANILPKGPSTDKIMGFMVEQPCFFKEMIENVSPVPSSLDAEQRACEEGIFIAESTLASHYLQSIFSKKTLPNRDILLKRFAELRCAPGNEGSLINEHDFILHLSKNTQNQFIFNLPNEDRRIFGIFLINECPVNVWKDSLLIKDLINDARVGEQLLGAALSNSHAALSLINLCDDRAVLEVLKQSVADEDDLYQQAVDARIKAVDTIVAAAKAKEDELIREYLKTQKKAQAVQTSALKKAKAGHKPHMSAEDLCKLVSGNSSTTCAPTVVLSTIRS